MSPDEAVRAITQFLGERVPVDVTTAQIQQLCQYLDTVPAPGESWFAALNRHSRFNPQYAVAQLIWDTMGRRGSLDDTLAVLEDGGDVVKRVRGVMQCGFYDAVTLMDVPSSAYPLETRVHSSWTMGGKEWWQVLEDDDGLPVFRSKGDSDIYPSGTPKQAVFRTGDSCALQTSLRSGPDEKTLEVVASPRPGDRDLTALRGRWMFPGGAAPFLCRFEP